MRTMQAEIINELGVKPEIDPIDEIRQRTDFLKDYLGETSLKGYVLGISGGQDSLLAGILAQKAVEEIRDEGGQAKFHAVLLPYGEQADRADALAACDFIKPDRLLDFNIKDSVDAFTQTFENTTGHKPADVNKGNAKGRLRMMAQYALGFDSGLLVIGTDHAAEAVMGFFTKYGDGGADITPLSGLNKRQGKQLLAALGAPRHFAEKTPTADLLDERPGQADEADTGISYNDIDDYLEGKAIDTAVAEQIEQRYRLTAHKRALPVTPFDVQ